MKLFPAQADDLLDVVSLPPTNGTQLNYRTEPLSKPQQWRLTLLVLVVAAPLVWLLAGIGRSLIGWSLFFETLLGTTSVLLAAWIGLCLVLKVDARYQRLALLLTGIALGGGYVWRFVSACDLHSLSLALVMVGATTVAIASQAAAWILVGPLVDLETMERWRRYLPGLRLRGYTPVCPEQLSYSVGLMMLVPAGVATAWLVQQRPTLGASWPLVLVAGLHGLWWAWQAIASLWGARDGYVSSWRATARALVVFLTYDIHQVAAAGVFRFPQRWLRPPVCRWLLVVGTLVLVGISQAVLSPADASDRLLHAAALLSQVVVGPPLLLATSLWFVAGTLLSRFEQELNQPRQLGLTQEVDGVEQPVETDDEEALTLTAWDNYVERIVNSSDERERGHLLAGFTERGDYPVLVDREIINQHVHLVGDSGASKTALGMAPYATQLIARGDCSVVVLDLKGDKAFFEGCRAEAARTRKLPFRWLSNQVGETTFGFNPFSQTHNARLSVDQLTQQLLQGLSLDYGIDYGKGYFTAMNMTVLSTVLANAEVGSFRELSRYLEDSDWYSSVGSQADWKEARHLVTIVKQLASIDALNLTPRVHPDRPAVHEQAIDVSDVMERPQVLYLSLKSAQDSMAAPAIARLVLWAAFTMASHRPQDANRTYFFVDEMQQVIGESIRLLFEQFRDLGGSLLGAHQTLGQLNRQGSDLRPTVESCTAFKQVFRASDLESMERLEKLSGMRQGHSPTWTQRYELGGGEAAERYHAAHASRGEVRVTEKETVRLSRQEIQQISSRQLSSLVRFTLGSGYTQFAGAMVPIRSMFHIAESLYKRRRKLPWPEAPGAYEVTTAPRNTGEDRPPTAPPVEIDNGFLDDFDSRGAENPTEV